MANGIEVNLCPHNLCLNFIDVEDEYDQINFHSYLQGYLNEDYDDYEDEDYDEVEIGYVTGTIATLPYTNKEVCSLEVGNHFYAHAALSPLYLANGNLSEKMWGKIGGDEMEYSMGSPRVIYLDKVVIKKGFASKNLGVNLVMATVKFIYKINQCEMPVLAILGVYDGHEGRYRSHETGQEAVRRYFTTHGFKPLKPKEEHAHFLPISKIRASSGLDNTEVYFYEHKKNLKKSKKVK